MATRSKSQKIGSAGHRLVSQIISSNSNWISREQDEDFGIDLEAEVCEPNVLGDIIKIQIKSHETVCIKKDKVITTIEHKYIEYAENCRIPVVFVIVDTTKQQAWYIWIQEILFEYRKRNIRLERKGFPVQIPLTNTLEQGLQKDLLTIAKRENLVQLEISLYETAMIALSTGNKNISDEILSLIDKYKSVTTESTIEIIIQTMITKSLESTCLSDLNDVNEIFFDLCRKYGDKFTKQQIIDMTLRNDTYSRSGVIGLGILYDDYFSEISTLSLPTEFQIRSSIPLYYYCKLREKYPGVCSHKLAYGDYDLTIDNYTIKDNGKEYLREKWVYRADSLFLDVIQTIA